MAKKGGGGGGSKQACAACKHQRRKCADDCLLAPYFPADQNQNFVNAHRLYGVGNIAKILKQVPENKREEAAKSIIFESNLRAQNPVLGVWGVILKLQNRLQAEIEQFLHVKGKVAEQQAIREQDQQNYVLMQAPNTPHEQDQQNYWHMQEANTPHEFDFQNPEPLLLPYQFPLPVIPDQPQPPSFVPEGIPVQAEPEPLLMPNLKTNQQALHADDRKPYLGKNDISWDEIAVDKKPSIESKGGGESSESRWGGVYWGRDIARWHLRYHIFFKHPALCPALERYLVYQINFEPLQIGGTTEEKGRDHKGLQGYNSKLKTTDSKGGSGVYIKSEDSENK